jgi:hypothetical protein
VAFALSAPRRSALPLGQWLGMTAILGAGGFSILVVAEEAAATTVALFAVVGCAGIFLCRSTQVTLNDPRLAALGNLWLIKIALTLILLYVGWMPQLDPASSPSWGYDPQRYYVQAQELIDNGWSPDLLSLNYVGVLYYYGAIFSVFGRNPIIPALVNVLVTLIATLYLVRTCYEAKPRRQPADWTIALALLLPEIVWFDVMTSRETLVGALLLIALLTVGRYLSRSSDVRLLGMLAVTAICALGIAAVRTSILLPLVAAVVLMVLLVKPQNRPQSLQRAILIGAATIAIIAGPSLAGYFGGYTFDIANTLQQATTAASNIASSEEVLWSDNSLGRLLMPNGVLQSIAFVPPRLIFYLVAPLPNVGVPLDELFVGSWSAWQKLVLVPSALLNVLLVPYALASLVDAIRQRKVNSAPLAMNVACWVTYAAIAGGNLVIHERYRVVASLLLVGCAWLGAHTCSRRLLTATTFCWYALLAFGSLVYFGYKST